MQDLIQQAVDLVRQAQYVVIFTGAGVSKESGIPTYRDKSDGQWSQVDAEQVASLRGYRDNPQRGWDWSLNNRQMMAQAQPNAGHFALAQLEQRVPRSLLITQNVDDLHEQAGTQHIVHLHGRIQEVKCFFDCQGAPTMLDLATLDLTVSPPPCPHCGRWTRPNIVMFGEILPLAELELAEQAAAECDLMLVVGTTGLVEPAARLPKIAKQRGTPIIEVNPNYSMISRLADVRLEAPSGVALPQILAAWVKTT
jgi:NAD-dependent deacetylase